MNNMNDKDLETYTDFSSYIKNNHPNMWEEIKDKTFFESRPILNKYTGINIDRPILYSIEKYMSKLILLKNLEKL